jgi:hypothetical protein
MGGLIATDEEVRQFWVDMGAEQAEYFQRRFGDWLENHNDGVQEQRDRTRGDRARMWKEVWELLG